MRLRTMPSFLASLFISVLALLSLNVIGMTDFLLPSKAQAIICPDGSFLPDERADECPTASGAGAPCDTDGSVLGMPTWYKYLPGTTDVGGKCRPYIENSADTLPIGIAVLEIMLRFAGILAAGFVTVGAFKYITSQGEPDAAKGAKSTIINAIIGLILTILATGIVSFIGNNINAS